MTYEDLTPGDIIWSSKGYYWEYIGTQKCGYDLKCHFIAYNRKSGQNQTYNPNADNFNRRLMEGSITLVKQREAIKVVRFVKTEAGTLVELADSEGDSKGMLPLGKISAYKTSNGVYVTRMSCSYTDEFFDISEEVLNGI